MARVLALALLFLADVTPRPETFRPEVARLLGSFKVGTTSITSISFSRDSRRLAVLAGDGQLSFWDAASKKEIRRLGKKTFNGHFSADAKLSRAVGPSYDRIAFRVMDLERDVEIRNYTDGHPSHYLTCAISPSGRRVAMVKNDTSVRLLDTASGDEMKTLLEPGLSQGGSLAWSPDEKTLAVHGWDSTVRLIDTGTGNVRASFKSTSNTSQFLGFSPDSTTLIHISTGAQLRLYDRNGLRRTGPDEAVPGARVAAFSPDNRYLAVVASGGRLRVWDARTWKVVRELEGGLLADIAFSPDGAVLVSGSSDGTVKIWGGTGGRADPIVKDPAPIVPGYLGITSGDEEDGTGAPVGAVMAGSAAEKAGLMEGDVITKVGANAVTSFDALRATVVSMKQGDEVEITYRRGKAEKKVKVKLGGRPAE